MGLSEQEINDEFCKEVGIRKTCCYIYNKDTSEIRYYTTNSGLYKSPKTWKHVIKGKYEPRYPNLISNPYNFLLLLNIQWFMFGELGDTYRRTGEETFEANYVKTRLKALKMCRSLGCGEGDMFNVYKERVRELPFTYMDNLYMDMGE